MTRLFVLGQPKAEKCHHECAARIAYTVGSPWQIGGRKKKNESSLGRVRQKDQLEWKCVSSTVLQVHVMVPHSQIGSVFIFVLSLGHPAVESMCPSPTPTEYQHSLLFTYRHTSREESNYRRNPSTGARRLPVVKVRHGIVFNGHVGCQFRQTIHRREEEEEDMETEGVGV